MANGQNQGLLNPNPAAPQGAAPIVPQGAAPATPGQPITPGAGPQEPTRARQPERNYQHNPLNDEDMGNVNKYVALSTKVIHSPQTREKILGRIKGQAHPYEEIADASLVVINRVEQEAQKTGEPWDQAVKLMGGANVVEQVIELAGAAGKIRQQIPEKDFRLIMASTVQKYYNQKVASGEITKAQAARDAYAASQANAKVQGVDTGRATQQLVATQEVRDQAGMSTAPQQVQGVNGLEAPQPAANPMKPETTMKEVLASGQGGLLNG